MRLHTKKSLSRLFGLFFFSITMASQPAYSASRNIDADSIRAISLDLEKDTLLSIINPKNNQSEEAKAALKIYYEKAITMATSFGYQNHGALRVTETVIGNEEPGTFVLATWPSDEADQNFESQPEWQQYKNMRPIIWDELNFYKSPVRQAKNLSFHESKFYTVAFAWLTPYQAGDYATYLEKIEKSVEDAGGRFIHDMQQPRFVSHSRPPIGPDQITFVEWDSQEGLNDFVNSSGFKSNSHYLSSGTKHFELYRIQPVFR